MATGLPLGANVRGSSAWIVWQLLRDPLRTRIRQLELDPGVHPYVVRQLKATGRAVPGVAAERCGFCRSVGGRRWCRVGLSRG